MKIEMYYRGGEKEQNSSQASARAKKCFAVQRKKQFDDQQRFVCLLAWCNPSLMSPLPLSRPQHFCFTQCCFKSCPIWLSIEWLSGHLASEGYWQNHKYTHNPTEQKAGNTRCALCNGSLVSYLGREKTAQWVTASCFGIPYGIVSRYCNPWKIRLMKMEARKACVIQYSPKRTQKVFNVSTGEHKTRKILLFVYCGPLPFDLCQAVSYVYSRAAVCNVQFKSCASKRFRVVWTWESKPLCPPMSLKQAEQQHPLSHHQLSNISASPWVQSWPIGAQAEHMGQAHS